MSGEGIFYQLVTTIRGRKHSAGSFVTAGVGAVTTPKGDGVPARTGVGVLTVTLPKKFGTCESLVAWLSLAAPAVATVCIGSYSPTTGVITFTTQTGGAAADTTGATLNWQAVFSDRTP
jgi:hypothetical protein